MSKFDRSLLKVIRTPSKATAVHIRSPATAPLRRTISPRSQLHEASLLDLAFELPDGFHVNFLACGDVVGGGCAAAVGPSGVVGGDLGRRSWVINIFQKLLLLVI